MADFSVKSKKAVKVAALEVVLEVPKLKFCSYKHSYKSQLMLDDTFESIETNKFITIALYPHQATIVAAMINIEDNRIIRVGYDRSGNELNKLSSDDIVLSSSAMVLSEPFGSGKTIEILALILERPVPKAFPLYVNSVTVMPRRYGHDGGFKTEVIRKFVGRDAHIRSNLIVVGSSVLIQWEDAIKQFTNLRYFVIGDVHHLKKFLEIYNARKLHNYDIVLLKNGTVTGNFQLPGETDHKTVRGMIDTVGKITRDKCWSRVIYDDFDTINIPSGTYAVNALFTIYISATTNPMYAKQVNRIYDNIIQGISVRNTMLYNVSSDNILFSNFNVVNNQEFTERSTRVTFINKYKYVYKNPNDNYMRLMGVMGEEARAVMEALNADAIGEACATLGIGLTNVADIFKRMLDTKYTNYIYDKDVINVITKAKKLLDSKEEHPKGKQPNKEKLTDYESSVRKKAVPAIKYYSIATSELLDQLGAEFAHKLENDGRAIDRVLENAKSGDCQVCSLPLEDSDAAIIVRCCGLIVCDLCGIKGNQIGYKYNPKSKENELYGNCANCKAFINPKSDLVYLDKTINIDDVFKSHGTEVTTEPVEKPVVTSEATEVAEVAEIVPDKTNPKLKCLVNIINGVDIPERMDHIVDIPHLLRGTIDNPPVGNNPKKMLLFANYNETLQSIDKHLTENNIKFVRLEGTYREKAATVAEFKISQVPVMLINSQQNCAGLNLEFCTDIVFFHKLINSQIEAQVVGRGQRILRKYNLQLHYLLFDNEIAI